MKSDKLKGSILLIIAAIFLAIYSAITKASEQYIYSSLFTCLVCFFGFLCLLIPVVYKKFTPLKTKDVTAVLIRGLVGGAAFLCFVISTRFVNLVDAVVLFSATPIFVPIIALFYTRVKMPALLWIPIIIGFVGIVLIVQPNSEMFTNPGEILALIAGILLSFALIAAGKLAKGGMTIMGIVFYFCFLATLVSLPFAIYFYREISYSGLWYVLSAGVAFIICQFTLSYAYKFATPSEIGPYWYFSILFTGLLGYFIFGQHIAIWKLVGMIIVIGAGLSTFFINKAKTPKDLTH